MRSLLVIKTGTKKELVDVHLPKLVKNAFFYVAVAASSRSGELSWLQIITTNSGGRAVNAIKFRPQRGLAVDDAYFDLQGMTLTSLSTDWDPYLVFKGCDVTGTKCKSSGKLCLLIV